MGGSFFMSISQRQQRKTFLACVVLVLGTLVLYAPLSRFDFINFDDTLYVVNNFHVNGGIHWRELPWCFQAGHAGNWHPLTWISHMLDCQFFGLRPGWHHLMNVVLHAVNSALLFVVLRLLTGAFWRSFVVAALFAWHPVHVESVAWIAERKDVLSTLFWMLTLWAYIRYAEERKSTAPVSGSWRYYVAAMVFFILGLMSKPMVVTLPFVMLLLDWWPLNRFGSMASRGDNPPIARADVPLPAVLPAMAEAKESGAQGTTRPVSEQLPRLLLEKVPFVVLAIGCCVLTIVAQHRGEAVASLFDLPLKLRVINAAISYVRYLGKIIWPVDLSIVYPFTINWPAWEIVVAIATLIAATGLAVWQRSIRQYLFGWLWFLGTLVPVIGVVQVGAQAMADRYDYIPSIGIFLAVCWGAYDLAKRWRHYQNLLGALAISALLACAVVSSKQIQFWRNSGTLFAYALDVTGDNYVARVNYANYLADNGQLAEAREQAEAGVRIGPYDSTTHGALGRVLVLQGRTGSGIAELRKALGLHFVSSDAVQLAMALTAQGQPSEAIAQYHSILQRKPDLPDALNNLAWILAASSHPEVRNGSEAVELAERACAVTHYSQPLMIGTLAAAYAEAGRFDAAITTAQKARDVAIAEGNTRVATRNLQLLELYRSHRAYHEGT